MGRIIDFIKAIAEKENSSEETNLEYIIANRISILKGANNEELMKEPKAAEMLLAWYNSAKSKARKGIEKIAVRGKNNNQLEKSNSSNEKGQNEGRQNDGEELML